MKVELIIEGMGCNHCIDTVRGILEKTGTRNIEVKLGLAGFILDEPGDLKTIIEKIDEQGYRVVDVLKHQG